MSKSMNLSPWEQNFLHENRILVHGQKMLVVSRQLEILIIFLTVLKMSVFLLRADPMLSILQARTLEWAAISFSNA